MSPDRSEQLRTLRMLLHQHYSIEEFQSLCQLLDVDFACLLGQTKLNKVYALVHQLSQNDGLVKLSNLVSKQKQEINWPEIPTIHKNGSGVLTVPGTMLELDLTEGANTGPLQELFENLSELAAGNDPNKPQLNREIREKAGALISNAIGQLTVSQKRDLIRFLYEQKLIMNDGYLVPLDGSDLRNIDLSWANLRQVRLYGANLERADLRLANLREADLSMANLKRANLRAYLGGAKLDRSDLSGAILINAQLVSASLVGSNLSGTNLNGADLTNANLEDACLKSADLSGAYLNNSNLSGCDLTDANLRGADLTGVNLSRATLLKAAVNDNQLRKSERMDHATLPNGEIKQ